MFSPLNDPTVADWFRRLDAAWKRMPADEQTRQREEVRQHLESLATSNTAQGQPLDAAWSAALAQFGNPSQIGRKIYREWCQSRTGFRPDMRAILFGLGLWALNYCLVQLLFALPLIALYFTGSQQYLHWNRTIIFDVVLQSFYFGGAFLIYGLIGHKYPLQAIKAALFTFVLSYLFAWVPVTAYFLSNHAHPSLGMVTRGLPLLPLRLAGVMMLAYLASVTKRGWYKPALDDFKLTLPKRPQASR